MGRSSRRRRRRRGNERARCKHKKKPIRKKNEREEAVDDGRRSATPPRANSAAGAESFVFLFFFLFFRFRFTKKKNGRDDAWRSASRAVHLPCRGLPGYYRVFPFSRTVLPSFTGFLAIAHRFTRFDQLLWIFLWSVVLFNK